MEASMTTTTARTIATIAMRSPPQTKRMMIAMAMLAMQIIHVTKKVTQILLCGK